MTGGMPRRIRYERVPTEAPNPASQDLDRLSPAAIARLMNREDLRAVRAVGRSAARIGAAAELIARALRRGGRLIFVGAGTSGRLGVLEAAECPPTFGTAATLVRGVIAGGRGAVFRSREGAEDDEQDGARQLRAVTRRGDVVVGLSASGVTPFVGAALRAARGRGAATVLVACNPRAVRGRLADVVIALDTGPEVLAGSTRLKAGTATKVVLNTLTTAAMARLGRVFGNRMVDVQPRSRKLRDRALRLVGELAGVSRPAAARALDASGGRPRVAIVMARRSLSRKTAMRVLRAAGGDLRAALGPARPRRRPASRSRRHRGSSGGAARHPVRAARGLPSRSREARRVP
jgi:N-acetylmuramic acid 6-phosphate etherase